MKGLILINAYSRMRAFEVQSSRLAEEFEAIGVEADVRRNDGFLARVEDGSISVGLGYDFCVYLDKDRYVLRALEASGIPVFNRYSAIEACDDKMMSCLELAGHGFRMPKTLPGMLCYDPGEPVRDSSVDAVVDALGLPVVVKECYGSMGKGVRLAYDREGLKALMERVDGVIRRAYFGTRNLKRKQNALDYMLYLWCGPGSPLYNKDKMTTFERYFIADESLYKESKGAYFKLGNNPEICANILKEFGLDPEKSRIINGHVPVRTLKGESPVRAGGMRLVIDGGFSKAYHATTGIAGYTLIYNSHGLELVQHNQFQSKEEVISSGTDIHSRIQLAEFKNHRMLVRDTDRGQELIEQVNNLQKLLLAYHSGLIKEKS